MSESKPTKEEQIDALLQHRAYNLAMKYAPSENLVQSDSYKRVFSVSKSEILDYLVSNRKIKDLVRMVPSDRDGFYAVPCKNGFNTYEQERNFLVKQKIARSEYEVWCAFLDYVLESSGTGLDFSTIKGTVPNPGTG